MNIHKYAKYQTQSKGKQYNASLVAFPLSKEFPFSSTVNCEAVQCLATKLKINQ